MRLTLAIPAYDEVDNIAAAVREAREACALVTGDTEVLIVDDGSRDGTGPAVDQLAREFPDVRVVRHERNRGFTGAMTTCFREARGDWVFLAPADGQIAMSELQLFDAQVPPADIVVGVRERRVEGVGRRLLSQGFHTLARLLFHLPDREFSSAFLFRKSLLDSMRFRSTPRSATLLPEILFRARSRGATIVVVTITQRARRAGRAKGGQLSVAALTLAELLRVAVVARMDERALRGSREQATPRTTRT